MDTGSIHIGGRDVAKETPAQRDIAMVFQQYSLYPHMTVRENLAFPLRSPILCTPEDEIFQKVGEIAEILQIADKLNNKATELSGGEMQRVSIGRALVRKPAIYLMDEPLSSLDAKLRADLRVELKRIQRHDNPLNSPGCMTVSKTNETTVPTTPRAVHVPPSSSCVASVAISHYRSHSLRLCPETFPKVAHAAVKPAVYQLVATLPTRFRCGV